MIDTSFIQYKLHNNKANYFYSRADMFTMSTFYFKPNIFSPTRLNNDGKFTSLIDNIFTNTTNDSISGTIVYDISDHLPIFYLTYTKKKRL